jgi:SpoVK/Ycf46/Vps4 family AAA+-type ATPase
MEIKEFKPREISLSKDFVGFPLIKRELQDIVSYLKHLNELAKEGKHEPKRMLIQAESGSIFFGPTGAGKTYALNCVANEAREEGYWLADGSVMLKKKEIEPKDVRDFFDECKKKSSKSPVLVLYDDVRELVGSKSIKSFAEAFGVSPHELNPALGEFRRQIDGFANCAYPIYVILTTIGEPGNVDEQIGRRLSRHVIFPKPSGESRTQLFQYYIKKFGHDPKSLDVITLSHLTDGVVTSKVEEIVSKASYKAGMGRGLTNKLLVEEITSSLQGPPLDILLTQELKVQTGYHEFGHILPAYLVGLDPILISIKPSADGSLGKCIYKPSPIVPSSSSKFFFAEVIANLGSTAIYVELGKGKEEGRLEDLVRAAEASLNLYALKNPLTKLRVGLRETYLTKGVFTQVKREEIENEIEKIKGEATNLAKEMVRENKSFIQEFVERELVPQEVMVRGEIISTLEKHDLGAGSWYERMCTTLSKLGYVV